MYICLQVEELEDLVEGLDAERKGLESSDEEEDSASIQWEGEVG